MKGDWKETYIIQRKPEEVYKSCSRRWRKMNKKGLGASTENTTLLQVCPFLPFYQPLRPSDIIERNKFIYLVASELHWSLYIGT